MKTLESLSNKKFEKLSEEVMDQIHGGDATRYTYSIYTNSDGSTSTYCYAETRTWIFGSYNYDASKSGYSSCTDNCFR